MSAARWDEMEQQIDDLRDENAELRRWLGVAAECVRDFSMNFDGVEAPSVAVFESLSRGEEVTEEVRRMYLGKDK